MQNFSLNLHHLMFCLLVLFAVVSNVLASSPGNNFRTNPYAVLGVTKEATQKEIQQQYRKLCLKYHPDKNRDSSYGIEDDFAFKEVQHAYSLIGTSDDRRNYDLSSRFSSFAKNSEYMHNANGFTSQYHFETGPSMYFKFGQNGPSFRFYQNQRFPRSYANPFQFDSPYFNSQKYGEATTTSATKRSHYVQKVTVPLEDLYDGGNYEFNLTSSFIERYKAAYRGRFLIPLISQAALAVVTTWLRSQKVNWFLSLFLFVTIVHFNLPTAPTKKTYPTKIKPGWKAGTKIKYNMDEPGGVSDVTFVIQEGNHEIYKRVGNDLHATISVKARRLHKGCTVYIDHLSRYGDPIKLKLRRGQVKEDGQVIVIEGLGWPISNSKSCGDLHIKIRIKT